MPWVPTKDAAKALGMPIRTVRYQAKNGTLQSRTVQGTSGKELQVWIEGDTKLMRAVTTTHDITPLALMSRKQQQLAQARYAIILSCGRLVAMTPAAAQDTQEAFAQLYNAGDLPVHAQHHTVVPSVSARSLRRWQAAFDAEGLAGLADGRAAAQRESTVDRHPELRDVVIGLLRTNPYMSAKYIRLMLLGTFTDRDDICVPSRRSIQRWLQNFKQREQSLYTLITDPDKYKSKYRPAIGKADEGIDRPNQVWELDSSPTDVMLLDAVGEVRRYNLIAALDVYTRRAKVLVTKSSNAAGIMQLMRLCLEDWGAPESVKTDQGKDYVSNPVASTIQRLGITQHLCVPFTPQQKPFVERFFGTLNHGLLPCLPGYIGHDVARRAAIRGQRSFAERISGADKRERVEELHLTPQQLQQAIDDWCASIYEQDVHSELGVSPAARLAQYNGVIHGYADADLIEIATAMPVNGRNGIRTVVGGEVRVQKVKYYSPDLQALSGHDVLCYEHNDFGKLYIADMRTGAFITLAINAEALGIPRAEVASTAKAIQQRVSREQHKEARRARAAVKPKDALDMILRGAQADRGADVVVLPQPVQPHHSEAATFAQQASDVIAAQNNVTDIYTDEEIARQREALQAERLAQQNKPTRTYFIDSNARVQHLLRQKLQGEVLSDVDADWLERQRQRDPDNYAIYERYIRSTLRAVVTQAG